MSGSPGITVPPGRRLMVETVSVQVNVSPPGSTLEAFINYTCLGQSVMLFVPLTYAYTDTVTGFDFYVALQPVRLYADPDSAMTVTVHSPTGEGGTLFLTVSGRLTTVTDDDH